MKVWTFLFIIFFTNGCGKIKFLSYSEFVGAIDSKSELSISTFPDFFPRKVYNIPYLYKDLVSHSKLNFQLFVRDPQKKVGPNPHIKTIMIKSFSYQIGDGPIVLLLKDHNKNFWQQGRKGKEDPPSFEYHPYKDIRVKV